MIGIEDAAEEASPEDPASRLGEVLKQFELANEQIDSDVARLHNKVALATVSLEHYLDVEITSSVSESCHATVSVTFEESTPAEALAAVQGIVIPDKTQSVPSSDGVTIRCLWGERYRDEVAEAEEVSSDGR